MPGVADGLLHKACLKVKINVHTYNVNVYKKNVSLQGSQKIGGWK